MCYFLRSFVLSFCLAAAAAAQAPPCAGPFCPLDGSSSPPPAPPTSPRGEHHQAVLRVTGSRGAGSGTLIHAAGGRGLVLTAAHVLEGSTNFRVAWHDGRTSPAAVVKSQRDLDVALLAVDAPADAVVIPLAEEDGWPKQGEVVELVGYGGGNFRHWQARVNGYAQTANTGLAQTLSLDTQTIGGDSGGAMIHRGKLVGVIWGGPLAGPRGPMLATHGTCCVAIRRWLGSTVPSTGGNVPREIYAPPSSRCPPGGNCPLAPPPVSPLAAGEIEALRRRIAQLEAELAGVKRQAPASIDSTSLANELLERMARDARFRGPAGPQGTDGRDGLDATSPPVNVDKLADEVKRRLAGGMRIRVEPVRR